MATVTTDIDVDLSDFDEWELRDELESRGYSVSSDPGGFKKIEELSNDELVDELQQRGYVIL